jgi:4-carboxymuconolactone decarboxylase
MDKKDLISGILFIVLLLNIKIMHANESIDNALNAHQVSLASISALTATGNMTLLKTELNTGLDAGLTINEIKEALVQLYAYCGFPRSLNAIGLLKTVVDERKASGISDALGKDDNPLTDTAGRYEKGRKVLEELTKTPQAKPAPGFGEFAPRIDAFLKEHLFADIFASNVLNIRQRELVTIAALASMQGTTGQLQSHINMGMNTGLTKDQLTELFSLIEKKISKTQGDSAREVLSKITTEGR